MAAPRPIEVFNEDGTPREDAAPSVLLYIDRTGADRDQPVDGVVNRGGGMYRLTPSDADELVGTIAIVDNGAFSVPRYSVLTICRTANRFLVYVPQSLADYSLTGGAPTIGEYINLSSGVDVIPQPPVRKAGVHEVYTVTPSAAHVALGVSIRLDAPDGATYPSSLFETFTNETASSSTTDPDDGTVIYSSPPPAPAALPQLAPELCDAVDLLSSGSYLVTRRSDSTVSHGVVLEGADGYFYAQGSMQPTTGQDIENLPEGYRDRESKTFFTCERLRGLKETTKPDRITVDGVLFECINVQDWQQLGAYHRVVLVKVL